MKKSCKYLLLVFTIVCYIWHPCDAQSPAHIGQLDSLFKEVSANPHFNGTVLVSDDDLVIYKNSKGYSNIAQHRLNTTSTPFPLASVSKTFTATAVMQLVEKGKLKLDDSLILYFPTFPYPNITLRQLLSHTSS